MAEKKECGFKSALKISNATFLWKKISSSVSAAWEIIIIKWISNMNVINIEIICVVAKTNFYQDTDFPSVKQKVSTEVLVTCAHKYPCWCDTGVSYLSFWLSYQSKSHKERDQTSLLMSVVTLFPSMPAFTLAWLLNTNSQFAFHFYLLLLIHCQLSKLVSMFPEYENESLGNNTSSSL